MRPLPLWPARNQRQRETKTPVPYTSKYASGGGGLGSLLAPSGAEAQVKALGGSGTLFAVVEGLVTAVASTQWHMHRSDLDAGDTLAPEKRNWKPIQHPALDRWNKPNKHFSRLRLVKTFQQHKELLGEGMLVVVKFGTLPVELWPIQPHKMEPVTDPDKFLLGWIYHGPDGQKVPLDHGEVIQVIQNPCPWDLYRGMGAVQTILTDLYGAAAAAEWHRQFFVNSARPDGVITVPVHLGPTEWEEFIERWDVAHRGVLRAHRVAVLEHGAEWKPTSYSPHDMMFADLRKASNEHVRNAFRMPRTILGEGETLNRATAEAQLWMYKSELIVPRLNDIRDDGLNFRLLEMYGPTGRGVEFGYVNPVAEDREAANKERTSKATAFKTYVDAGVHPDSAAEVCGLPPLKMAAAPVQAPATPAQQPAPVEPAAARLELVLSTAGWDTAALAPAHTSNGHGHHHNGHGRQARPALPRAAAESDEAEPDLSGVRTDVDQALDRLESDYQATLHAQIDSLVRQIEEAVDADDLDALAATTVPDDLHGAGIVQQALEDMAQTAADRAVDEVAAEDVTVDPDDVAEELDGMSELGAVAAAAAATVAAGLALSAIREARRLYRPGVGGADVAGQVRAYLESLKGADRLAEFGGELHRATNLGRVSVFTVALRVKPGGIARAFEQNDLRTCPPCSEINGHVFTSLEDAFLVYGGGGYVACQGKWRCRGTLYVTWS